MNAPSPSKLKLSYAATMRLEQIVRVRAVLKEANVSTEDIEITIDSAEETIEFSCDVAGYLTLSGKCRTS